MNRRSFLYTSALGIVQAFFATDPKIHLCPGPHGFTRMHCVETGGERARVVREWLLAQAVPDETHRELPYVWPEGTQPPAS